MLLNKKKKFVFFRLLLLLSETNSLRRTTTHVFFAVAVLPNSKKHKQTLIGLRKSAFQSIAKLSQKKRVWSYSLRWLKM